MVTTSDGGTVLLARLKLLKRVPQNAYDSFRHADRGEFMDKNGMPRSDIDFYRALCGYQIPETGQYCAGDLGFVYRVPYGSALNLTGTLAEDVARLASDDPYYCIDQTQWFLYHTSGLVQLDDGSYRVIAKAKRDDRGRRIGRRPMPESLRYSLGPSAPARGIVGQLPTLPIAVLCPLCLRANLVEIPGVDVHKQDAERHKRAEESVAWHTANKSWEGIMKKEPFG